MDATIKYYISNPDNTYTEVLKTDPIISMPALFWTDANGNENRSIVIENNNDMQSRIFSMKSIEQRKAIGTDEWLAVPKTYREPVANDENYRYLMNGQEEPEPFEVDGVTLKAGLVTQSQFFIIMVGLNSFGVPVSLFDYFLQALAQKKGLTIV